MRRGTKGPGGLALLMALLLTATVLASSGCLEEEGPDDGGGIPSDRRDATLEVTGDVNEPRTFSLEDLVDLGTEDFEATFVNSVGTTEAANYTGVRLRAVLDEVGPKASAQVVGIEASDGYGVDLFLSDVTDDTHLALKKDGEWQDLAEHGAIRVVDTNLRSVYWVRQVVRLTLGPSHSVPVSGLANNTDPLTAAYVHENGQDVSWREGDRNRSGRGIPMEDIIGMIDADTHWGYLLDVRTGEDSHAPQELQDFLGDDEYFLAEDRGSLSIIRDGLVWTAPVMALNVTPGLKVHGDVGHQKCMTLREVRQLPIRDVSHGGSVYRGAALEAVLAEAGTVVGVDAVEAIAKDGYSAVFPYWNVSSATMAYERDGVALGPEDGYLRVVDSSRPGNYHVAQVRGLRVLTSTPVQVEGTGWDPDVFNASDVLTIGFIDEHANMTAAYNDGRRDREYPAITWEAVLEGIRLGGDLGALASINLTTRDGSTHSWEASDLANRTGTGLAVDSRGRYVAVREQMGEYALDVVVLEVVRR